MIPQPQKGLFFGNLNRLDTSALVQSLIGIAQEFEKEGIYQLSLPSREILVVYAQAFVNEVCDETRFDKKLSQALETLRNGAAGDGLFTSNTQEANWGKAHRLLMPAFGMTAVREMFPQMLDIAEQLMLKIERFGDKHPLNVADEMTRLTLDTIALCAFDYRFNSFYNDKMHPFVQSMVDHLIEAGKIALRPSIQKPFMFGSNRRYREQVDYMSQVADKVIAERKIHPTDKKDLLNVMLKGVDSVTGEKLSDENIRYQLITFLVAGHETTSGLLSFTVYLLLKNPSILAKLREEIDTVLGNDSPRMEHIKNLKYTEKVLKESLRIYPTASAFSVAPFSDTTLGGKYPIAKDQLILILPWMLHRDKKAWGEDVDVFRPERFDNESFSSMPPNSWKPFGNGQRGCIGMSFAMQEAILVMAMLLQRFDISESDPNYTLHIQETLTIKPESFFIKAQRRPNIITKKSDSVPKNIENATSMTSQEGGIPLLILYGSNSGSSANFAQRIANASQQIGFQSVVGELDAYVNRLPKTGAVLIITASYEGQPPHNAKKFVTWLSNVGAGALTGVKYAVLGCGHADWVKTYQAVPRKLDEAMSEKGAERLLARGEANAAGDFIGDYDDWQAAILAQLTSHFHPKTDELTTKWFQVSVSTERAKYLQQTVLQNCRVVENRELVDSNHPQKRSKRHLELAFAEKQVFQAGDYVSVLPSNPKNLVERVLKQFTLSDDNQLVIQKIKNIQLHLPTDYPVSVLDVFTNYVELAQPATKKQIQILADNCPCPPEKYALLGCMETENYTAAVLNKRLSLLDLLEKFKSVDLSLSDFLAMLPPLKPRLYSISSSPLWNDKQLTLTVSVVNAAAWLGKGIFEGVASNYLARLQPNVPLKINILPAALAFHLPADTQQPLLMVCAGTGLAPFRGFVQERAIQKTNGQKVGKSLLFFGCDHPDWDDLYKTEFLEWEKQGIVNLHYAYSMLPDGDVTFVQHKLWKERKIVYDYLEMGAKIYVCGDGKYMGTAVRQTFVNIYQTMAQVSASEAEIWMQQMQKEGIRYAADLFL